MQLPWIQSRCLRVPKCPGVRVCRVATAPTSVSEQKPIPAAPGGALSKQVEDSTTGVQASSLFHCAQAPAQVEARLRRSSCHARCADASLFTQDRGEHPITMLKSVSDMGIKIDHRSHSQSTVGTATPAAAAVAYTLSDPLHIPCISPRLPVCTRHKRNR
jgi:hypothetical protein